MTTLLEHNLAQAQKMTERQLQDRVLAIAKLHGWRTFHPYDSRRSTPGYPDLTMVNVIQGRVLFVELKSAKGRLTSDQVDWIADLEHVADKIRDDSTFEDSDRLDVYTWRPADLVNGHIEATLAGVQ